MLAKPVLEDHNSVLIAVKRRRRDRGIILVTTLLLLTLLASFALATQTKAIAQSQVARKTLSVHQERLDLQSARAIALPIAGKMILIASEAGDDLEGHQTRFQFDGELIIVTLKAGVRRKWLEIGLALEH